MNPNPYFGSYMTTRHTIYLSVAILIATCMACQTSPKSEDTSNPGTEDFAKLVTQLDEFKQEQKRIDSINKKSAFPVTVSIEIIDTSFFDEDKGKNISLAFITEQHPYEKRTMYTVKYDKDNKKIVTVTKAHKQFEKTDAGTPEDVPLPPIR
ncbi:hypothetical protein [Paraflavitalea sp. CAU 1676]|uniref:hypothetical protein n=1 Tax=Paraflavitalea sp. CAU 1676 TaxID=3032598 RepID=UPI0023DAEEAA|nr:hypothetical protein [Paraflavitalea sp. CAU 1676]MDF2193473.1 hypothetical protein [Paraflavitalea sp. CAU 1676]